VYYSLRKGQEADKDWLYDLYSLTLRPAIEKTWGWDEAFQKASFSEHLSPEKFEILTIEGNNIGGFMLEEREDCLWLEMLLIDQAYQRRGIGSRLIRQLQREAARKNKPLKLSVLKKNPVLPFYHKLDFWDEGEDEASYRMIWSDPKNPRMKRFFIGI
jgi:GNAT superfamily N-acetyltransferase